MGRLKKGILGGFTGKVGKMAGYPLNGQDIVRTIGKRVKPFTEKELANQKKFATSQEWLSPLTDFLRVGFQDYAPTYQGFVAAKAYNSKHALVADDSGFYMNPEMILVSYGSQVSPANAGVKREAPLQLTFSWDTEGKYPYNDRAMLLVYDPESHYTSFETAGPRRNTGTATLILSKKFEGKKVHAYLAFVAEDRKSRSNSMYLGEIEV